MVYADRDGMKQSFRSLSASACTGDNIVTKAREFISAYRQTNHGIIITYYYFQFAHNMWTMESVSAVKSASLFI